MLLSLFECSSIKFENMTDALKVMLPLVFPQNIPQILGTQEFVTTTDKQEPVFSICKCEVPYKSLLPLSRCITYYPTVLTCTSFGLCKYSVNFDEYQRVKI